MDRNITLKIVVARKPGELDHKLQIVTNQTLRVFPVAFFVGHPPKSITTLIPFHPPELVFKLELTNAVDIWNLGCTISIQAHFPYQENPIFTF